MYIDEPYCENECFNCSVKENKMHDIKYWFRQVLEQLYSTDNLEIDSLERCVQEMCSLIGMKIPQQDICIKRMKDKKDVQVYNIKPHTIISEWLEFNNSYLKQLPVSQ